jgi:hypothetical protein
MKAVWVGMLLIASVVAGCASSEGESYAMAGYDWPGLERVAIVEVTGAPYGEAVKNQIAGMFQMELLKRGYGVIERKDVQAVLKEQEFQASDITTGQGAAQAGEILNVPAVMLVSIPKYKDRMTITAKMVEVETGTVLWIGNATGDTGKGLATFLGAAAGAAVGAAAAGGDTGDRVLGGVLGGVVGGVAGNALSPEQEEQVRKVVADACEGMPYRVPVPPKKK